MPLHDVCVLAWHPTFSDCSDERHCFGAQPLYLRGIRRSAHVSVRAEAQRVLELEREAGLLAIALVLAFVATIYPSWRASRVNPAEALRYE